MKKIWIISVLFSMCGFIGHAQALEADIIGAQVVRILVTDDQVNGGCMALLDRDITTSSTSATPLDCATPSGASDRWVTFACNSPDVGDWPTRSNAQRLFDTAQIAYAIQSRVRIKIDDSRKINGHCLGVALQVYR